MKNAARLFAILFGLVLIAATIINADLIVKSQKALADGIFRSSSSAKPARYHLVAVFPDTDDSYFRGLINGLNEEALKIEAVVQIFRYPAESNTEAERYFNLAMAARVDGLIMFSKRGDPLAERKALADKNNVRFVPVFMDSPLDEDTFFVGSDLKKQGFASASAILSRLGNSARIGVILPQTGSENILNEAFYQGVLEAMKNYPGARVVAAIRSRPGAMSGEESAASMLDSREPVNALICSSARDTIGAVQVVVDRNAVGKVLIVGTDETPEISRYIQNGVVAASIVRDSSAIGRSALHAFSDMLSGIKNPARYESGFLVLDQQSLKAAAR